jgi:hypothetical protein
VRQLEQEGIDVAGAEATGQLEVHPWDDAYLQDNRFDQFHMLELVKQAIAKQPPGEVTDAQGAQEAAAVRDARALRGDLPGLRSGRILRRPALFRGRLVASAPDVRVYDRLAHQ